ncbi:hypothetical protein, partial [Cronobacter turicensis]|uniref:hypothetical protein n=1 Tax=Cronobacter turicensis TaxID=413502 RepID=UPI0024C3E9C7
AGKQSAPAKGNVKTVRYVKSEKSCEAQANGFRVAHREQGRGLALSRLRYAGQVIRSLTARADMRGSDAKSNLT